jgi:hypothetical protein
MGAAVAVDGILKYDIELVGTNEVVEIYVLSLSLLLQCVYTYHDRDQRNNSNSQMDGRSYADDRKLVSV